MFNEQFTVKLSRKCVFKPD